MADSMDLVQQRVEENLQRHIQNARARKPGTARVLCIDCDAPSQRLADKPFRVCSVA